MSKVWRMAFFLHNFHHKSITVYYLIESTQLSNQTNMATKRNFYFNNKNKLPTSMKLSCLFLKSKISSLQQRDFGCHCPLSSAHRLISSTGSISYTINILAPLRKQHHETVVNSSITVLSSSLWPSLGGSCKHIGDNKCQVKTCSDS
jgi:hypothetical protein